MPMRSRILLALRCEDAFQPWIRRPEVDDVAREQIAKPDAISKPLHTREHTTLNHTVVVA